MDLRWSTQDNHFYSLHYYVNNELKDTITGFIGFASLKRHVDYLAEDIKDITLSKIR